jgi:bacterioferritin
LNEMKHMEKLAERIIFLEAIPTYVPKGKPHPAGDALAMVQADKNLEYEAVKMYNRLVKTCVEEEDNGSRAILEEILRDEEKHADLFETEERRIKDMDKAYLATLAG